MTDTVRVKIHLPDPNSRVTYYPPGEPELSRDLADSEEVDVDSDFAQLLIASNRGAILPPEADAP